MAKVDLAAMHGELTNPGKAVHPRFVVGVEGNSGVGKSTLCRALCVRLPSALVLPESAFIHGSESLPKFPPTDRSELRRENAIWIKIESRRWARRQASHAVPHIVDGTPVGVLAFELAKAQLGYISEPTLLAEAYLAQVLPALSMPSVWIFLSAKPGIVAQRLRLRGDNHPFLTDARSLGHIDSIRYRFYCDYASPDGAIWIDTSERTPAEIIDEVAALVASRRGRRLDGALKRFLRDIALGRFIA